MAFPHRRGVDPVDAESAGLEPPFCPHGPTLVFERYYQDHEPRQFFACAVHRDRKGCPFFHWVDETITEEKRKRWKALFVDNQPSLDRMQLTETLVAVSSYPTSQRQFCRSCGLLLGEERKRDKGNPEENCHRGHVVKVGVFEQELKEPTRLLNPVDDNKSQAQFYFSKSSVSFLCSEIQRLHFSKVLCIGTPRLHEVLLKEGTTKSLLLDVDHRYAQFYSPEHYQRYNMFNSFFYEPSGRDICQQFLTRDHDEDSIVMVVDPPFGGLAEVLGRSIGKLWVMAGYDVPTMLVFPYFNEQHLCSALPSLTMSDYQVTYDNHKHFSLSSRKKSKPSPVRIYTNLPNPGLHLPAEEGYRLCKQCNRYVSAENSHCAKCNTCTSKDGRKYVHCDTCAKCVKSSRVHCPTCNRCELADHSCEKSTPVGCHVCGSLEHKRRDCPNKVEVKRHVKAQKRKRPMNTDEMPKRKKQKAN